MTCASVASHLMSKHDSLPCSLIAVSAKLNDHSVRSFTNCDEISATYPYLPASVVFLSGPFNHFVSVTCLKVMLLILT